MTETETGGKPGGGGARGTEGRGADKETDRTEGTTEGREKTRTVEGGREGAIVGKPKEEEEGKEEEGRTETAEETGIDKEANPESESGNRRSDGDKEYKTETDKTPESPRTRNWSIPKLIE